MVTDMPCSGNGASIADDAEVAVPAATTHEGTIAERALGDSAIEADRKTCGKWEDLFSESGTFSAAASTAAAAAISGVDCGLGDGKNNINGDLCTEGGDVKVADAACHRSAALRSELGTRESSASASDALAEAPLLWSEEADAASRPHADLAAAVTGGLCGSTGEKQSADGIFILRPLLRRYDRAAVSTDSMPNTRSNCARKRCYTSFMRKKIKK